MKIDVYLSYDTIMPFPNLVQASFCLIYLKLLSNYNRNYLNIDQNWLNFNLKYFNLIKMGLIVKNWWNTIEIILIKITIIRIILIKYVEHAFLIKTNISFWKKNIKRILHFWKYHDRSSNIVVVFLAKFVSIVATLTKDV